MEVKQSPTTLCSISPCVVVLYIVCIHFEWQPLELVGVKLANIPGECRGQLDYNNECFNYSGTTSVCPKTSGNVLIIVLIQTVSISCYTQHCTDVPGASSDPGLDVTQSCE